MPARCLQPARAALMTVSRRIRCCTHVPWCAASQLSAAGSQCQTDAASTVWAGIWARMKPLPSWKQLPSHPNQLPSPLLRLRRNLPLRWRRCVCAYCMAWVLRSHHLTHVIPSPQDAGLGLAEQPATVDDDLFGMVRTALPGFSGSSQLTSMHEFSLEAFLVARPPLQAQWTTDCLAWCVLALWVGVSPPPHLGLASFTAREC